MKNNLPFYLLAFFAIVIGLYPLLYSMMGDSDGLLGSKSAALLANTWWNIGFYTHIIFGGLAMLTGWSQFSAKLRKAKPALHRNLGKLYIISVLLSGLAAFSIGPFATTGWIAAVGFMSLAIIWLFTTMQAYVTVKKGQYLLHEKMMVYSYAACFAAVTLRILMPLLIAITGSFDLAYPMVAWLCWIPNLLFAHFVVINKWRPYLA